MDSVKTANILLIVVLVMLVALAVMQVFKKEYIVDAQGNVSTIKTSLGKKISPTNATKDRFLCNPCKTLQVLKK